MLAIAVLVLFAAGVVAGFAYFLRDTQFRGGAALRLSESGGKLLRTLGEEFFLNPWFYVVFALVLVLERLIPARPQPLVSKGLRMDLWWIPVKLAANAAVLPIYVLLLGTVYQRYLGFLTVDAAAQWPWVVRVLLALLLGDFLFWFTHYVRHKVRVLWYFHAVHHSQKELNFFTEYRVHPLDDLFAWTVGFVPLLMFSHSFATIVAVVWIRHWHSRLYHSNIRSNFGFLRYVLVTPQSHRVHHSVERRHFDKNFGLTFSIWDHLFGTQYRGYDEYPPTGIPDEAFPCEQEAMRFAGLSNVVEQLLYPFRAVARGPS
jgi:sterol desaturase/sphingolipid hydroxylase (fatty acid hydroxylase superfamily)